MVPCFLGGAAIPPDLPRERSRKAFIRGAHEQRDCHANGNQPQYRQGFLAAGHGQDGGLNSISYLRKNRPALIQARSSPSVPVGQSILRIAPAVAKREKLFGHAAMWQRNRSRLVMKGWAVGEEPGKQLSRSQ